MAKIRMEIAKQLELEKREKKEKKAAKKAEKKAKKDKKDSKKGKGGSDSEEIELRRNGNDTEKRERIEIRDANKQDRRSIEQIKGDDYSQFQRRENRNGENIARYGDAYSERSSRKRERSDSRNRETRRSSRDEPTNNRHIAEKEGYGLVTDNSIRENRKSEFLGPNPKLLEKKAKLEREKETAKLKPKESVKSLSQEEKLKRIQGMEEDAKRFEDKRKIRLQPPSTDKEAENKNASFMHGIRNQVYNSNETSMEERLKQNRHYTQRGQNLDSEGFMRR
jgi:hypothetical protein